MQSAHSKKQGENSCILNCSLNLRKKSGIGFNKTQDCKSHLSNLKTFHIYLLHFVRACFMYSYVFQCLFCCVFLFCFVFYIILLSNRVLTTPSLMILLPVHLKRLFLYNYSSKIPKRENDDHQVNSTLITVHGSLFFSLLLIDYFSLYYVNITTPSQNSLSFGYSRSG